MTFNEFVELSGCEYSPMVRVIGMPKKWSDGFVVHADSVAFADLGHLFDLSDYRVSSHSGGVYRLMRK
jgi:hypothetical protein